MNRGNLRLSPFMGAYDIKFTFFIVLGFFIVFLLTSRTISTIFLIFFIIGLLLLLSRLYGRLSKPWRRIHFSTMSVYATLLGFEYGSKDTEGRNQELSDKDINRLFKKLLQMLYSDYTDKDAEKLIKQANTKVRKFTDQAGLKKFFQKKLKDNSKQKVEKSLETIRKKFQEEIPNVQFIIAEIIEKEYGLEERQRYIQALLTGSAF